MKFADLSIVITVMVIVIMMVLPLPPLVLDIFLMLNISFAVMTLLLSMYIKESLEFAVFPALLLILTLFRLALNVSSTRLILLRGFAGKIIQVFGQFVVGGEILVGIVVFLILIIIQFVVITKGAERVAEVAARFTLDAMPGKQMAIDADLNAGLITDREAKVRREKIQKEADFYGAMDGASKFVKGDAIAGIIITIVNIVGGLIKGVAQDGGTFAEALEQYSLLAVGDGLVSQIPALLISTATGIVVTRAASGKSMGDDLVFQISRQPRVMFITSAFIAALGLIPGIPLIPFWTLSTILAFLGYRMRVALQQEKEVEQQLIAQEVEEQSAGPNEIYDLLHVDRIAVELGFGLLPMADGDDSEMSTRINVIRKQVAMELGIIVPTIRVRDNIQMGNPNKYEIKLHGITVGEGVLHLDKLLAMDSGMSQEEVDGIPTTEPAFGLPAKWIDEDNRERAEILGYTVVDAPTVFATHLTQIIKGSAAKIFNRKDVKELLELVKVRNGSVVEDLIPDILTEGQVQAVFENLLREQVSLRNMETILETLLDFAPITRDTDVLTEYARQALGSQISMQFTENGKLYVVTLSNQVEEIIKESLQPSDSGTYISIDPKIGEQIIQGVNKLNELFAAKDQIPVVLASDGIRLYFRRLIENAATHVAVLSYNELDPSLDVEALGTI